VRPKKPIIIKENRDKKPRDSHTIHLSLRKVPWRLHRALRIYAALHNLKGVEPAVYQILERDMGLQQLILQYRITARSEEVRRAAREQLAMLNPSAFPAGRSDDEDAEE